MPDLNWTLLGEIEPGSNWLLTGLTTANLFKFEHHNPPRRALLQVAETDGQQWFFEPRTLSSDRDAQLLLLDHAAVFGGERRLSLRFADPSLNVRNWTVRVSAAWIDLKSTDYTEVLATMAIAVEGLTAGQLGQNASFLDLINGQAAIANQLTALQSSATQRHAQTTAKLDAILTLLNDAEPEPEPTPTTALTFASAGDANGVFYWLGTSYGTTAWTNPQSLSVMAAVISSLEGGQLTMLTNRTAAVQFYSTSAANQWVAFDLGSGNLLTPNRYAIQHDSETGYYLRSWKLQGSNAVVANTVADMAAAVWTDLKTHTGDAMINSPNGWGGWDVTGVTTGYRWLRILMTGANSSGDNYLVLGEVEFYGSFVRT